MPADQTRSGSQAQPGNPLDCRLCLPNRRSWLSASAVAIGSACLTKLPQSLSAGETPKDLTVFSGIELAIATICTDGFVNQHHEPAMEFIPQFGFRNVELNLWYPEHIRPAYTRQLKSRCADAGLRPISVQGTGFAAQGGRDGIIKDVSHKLLLMQYARDLDCRIVKFTGAKRGTQGGLDAIIEVCKEIAPAAEELGVLVTLENHAGNNLETIEDYDKVFSAIASSNIGLCLDTGHFEGVGIRLSDVIQRLHSRTLHVDLKDCREFGKGHDTVPFGEGTTDFDAFLTQLTATGFQGYLVIEQAWSEPQGEWKRDLTAAHDRFQKWETNRPGP